MTLQWKMYKVFELYYVNFWNVYWNKLYLVAGVFLDAKMVLECRSFTLPQQFTPKYKEPGNHNSGEDLVRTCEFGPYLEILPITVLLTCVYCLKTSPANTFLIVHRLVEVSVSAATCFIGSGRACWSDWFLCLPLPKLRPNTWHWNTSPAGW